MKEERLGSPLPLKLALRPVTWRLGLRRFGCSTSTTNVHLWNVAWALITDMWGVPCMCNTCLMRIPRAHICSDVFPF